jgi:hypothetical protein
MADTTASRTKSAPGSLTLGTLVAQREHRWLWLPRRIRLTHSAVVTQHDREGRADQGIGRDCQRGYRAGRG